MNNIRFVSPDLEWTDSMKASVMQKIFEPLERHMKDKAFDLSVQLTMERKRMCSRQPEFSMSVILKTFDGHRNEVIRRHGREFHALVTDVSSGLRARIRRGHRRFSIHALRFLPSVVRGHVETH